MKPPILPGLLAGLVLSLTAATATFAAPPSAPAADIKLAREILAEQIAINTVIPTGSTKAAEALAARFKAAGYEPQVLAPPEHPHKGNAVVRLKGSGKAKPVLWICHLDVVEARAEDWTQPPFELTEKDGWFYGRGTADVKGDCSLMAAALIRLKREGFVPDRDIIAAFTADEESGDANGPEWLLASHRPLIDAEFVMNPDGGGGGLRDGKPVMFGVQTSEKVYLTFRLEVTDKGGHSSVPPKENAIVRLAEGLSRMAKYEFPLHLTATTRKFFAAMSAFETGQARADMLAVSGESPDQAAAARLAADPIQNAQLRTTCVATGIEGGHAENALPQRARAVLQCRIMPGETEAETKARVVAALADPKIEVTVISPAVPSPESPPNPKVFGAIEKVIQAVHPGVPVVPIMDVGASDGVFTRGAGIPTYAAGSIFGDMDDVRAHGRDERIRTSAFEQGVWITYQLMRETSRAW